MVSRNPVLYFSYASILAHSADFAETWAEAWVGKAIKIGLLEIGQCIDYEHHKASRRVGLVIQWRDDLQVVTKL